MIPEVVVPHIFQPISAAKTDDETFPSCSSVVIVHAFQYGVSGNPLNIPAGVPGSVRAAQVLGERVCCKGSK